MNVGNLSKLMTIIPDASQTGVPSLDAGQSAVAAVGMGYIWTNVACFTGLVGNFMNAAISAAQAQAGAAAANPQMITQMMAPILTNAFSTLVPPTYMYYVFGILAGFVGGLAFLRKESKLIDAPFAGIIPAVLVLAVMIIIGSLAGSAMLSLMGQSVSQPVKAVVGALFTLSAVDMLLIFVVTYLCTTAGAFCAAALWMLIERSRGAPAAAGKAKKK